MRNSASGSSVVLGALIFAIVSTPAFAQYPADTASGAPAVAVSQPLNRASADQRPSLVVMNFESGTVAAKVKDKHGFSAFLAAMRGESDNAHYDPAELGAGIADLLVEKLLNTGEFRLLERKQLEATAREQGIVSTGAITTATPSDRAAVIGARYMVTGSVTKFGFEEHQVGGFVTSVATFGMLSLKRHRTEVTLTARVIDVATGEIIASFDGEGVSNKGGGISLMGLGSHGGGGANGENRNFKESAIGEATERAVQNLTEKLAAKREMLAIR